jgi:glyceraldehyde 3-phosphate dehydrogenase
MISIAINGVGRIGKMLLRILCEDEAAQNITIKAINIGPADPAALEYLITYDSLYGQYPKKVSYQNGMLTIGKQQIKVFHELDAHKLPWKSLGIDWVVDATGKYTKRELAQQHLDAGAKHVLITAPAQGDDITIVMGINEKDFSSQKHAVVSLGSCTTNAVAPMLKVLTQAFDIQSALLNTIHAYTNTQALLDVNPTAHDLRRSRAAALNMVPTSTGAMEAVFKVLPSLQGKLAGSAIRVPVPVVSLADVTFIAEKPVTTEQIIAAFDAAQKSLPGILTTTTIPLVSEDYKKNPHSVVVDHTLTTSVGTMGRVFGWYDNEYGYAMRLRDFLLYAAR